MSDVMPDYFIASHSNDGLAMEPHCGCGQTLDEDYFCGACQRQCSCTEVRCQDQATLQVVQQFIQEHERFHKFSARLVDA